MRRAAVRAFRTARQVPHQTLFRSGRSSVLHASRYALSVRSASSSSRPESNVAKPASSMYIRRFSIALVSSLVGYGAWYTYKGGESKGDIVSQQSRAITTSSYSGAVSSDPERKAVVVGADSLYTGTIPGDQPIFKDTDAAGRRVLEMLTPEQATQKLRRNETSYIVGRGKGVVRYDVVQIPSNDPIEDDHAEKIIELPQSVTGQSVPSDWMFWGVFDGHA